MLGIFIGVASVIWLLSIGEGIGRAAEEQIAGLGARNIIVRTIKPSADEVQDGGYGLTRDDYDRLVSTIRTIDTGRADPRGDARVSLRHAQVRRPLRRLHARVRRGHAAGARPRPVPHRRRPGRGAQLLRAGRRERPSGCFRSAIPSASRSWSTRTSTRSSA